VVKYEASSGGAVTGRKVNVEEKETLAQLRHGLGLFARLPVAGQRATFVHGTVEGSASGEDTVGKEEDTGCGRVEGEEVEEQEGEGKAADEEEESEVEDEEKEDQEEKEEWVGQDTEEVDGSQTGGGKRPRAEQIAAAGLPARLLQLTASPPPSTYSPSSSGSRGSEVGGRGRGRGAVHAFQQGTRRRRLEVIFCGHPRPHPLHAPRAQAPAGCRAGGGGPGTAKGKGIWRGGRAWHRCVSAQSS